MSIFQYYLGFSWLCLCWQIHCRETPVFPDCSAWLLYRLSNWATSSCWGFYESCFLLRDLERKSFWVPTQWQLNIIYQDSTIRGCSLQKRWHAELLPCKRCCHLSPAMIDGQVSTGGKGPKVWTKFHRPLSLWEKHKDSLSFRRKAVFGGVAFSLDYADSVTDGKLFHCDYHQQGRSNPKHRNWTHIKYLGPSPNFDDWKWIRCFTF